MVSLVPKLTIYFYKKIKLFLKKNKAQDIMKENHFLFSALYGEQINIPLGIYPFEPQKLKLLRKGTI